MSLVTFLSLGKVVASGHSAHFDIFATSARLLWQGKNPHGLIYSAGYWFYSPICGMFFFGPFAFLPYVVGLALFMAVSLGLFFWGLWVLLKLYPLSSHRRSLFLFLLSSELIGAILNTRLELAMLGILLLAMCQLINKNQVGIAACLMAFICNWKFTTLPSAGLVAVVTLFFRPWRFFSFYFLAWLLAFFLAPWFWQGTTFFTEVHQTWRETMQHFMVQNDAWRTFQHVFRFLEQTLGLKWDLSTVQRFSAGVGLVLAIFIGRIAFLASSRKRYEATEILLLALSWGSAYSLMLSPLSQSAAYIFYTPLLLGAFRVWEFKKWMGGIIFVSWFFVSLAYSDVVPRVAREVFVHHSVKPVGILLLVVFVTLGQLRSNTRHRLA